MQLRPATSGNMHDKQQGMSLCGKDRDETVVKTRKAGMQLVTPTNGKLQRTGSRECHPSCKGRAAELRKQRMASCEERAAHKTRMASCKGNAAKDIRNASCKGRQPSRGEAVSCGAGSDA